MLFLSFYTALRNAAAAAQAASATVLDFSVGSPFRALLEGAASLAMWLQLQMLRLMALIRAATATGADLDSWMADFGLVTRLPGVYATGATTFARYAPVQTALVPVGTLCKTADGLQSFIVTADSGNSRWNAGLGGYLMPAGTGSVTVPVAAVVPGTAGNIQLGTLTLIASALSGVDTLANGAPFVNGVNPEGDAALRLRFAQAVAGLRRATLDAVNAAVAGVQQGIVFAVSENYTNDGQWLPGYFTVNIDDGTGYPPDTLLAAVRSAVDAVRGLTIRFGVFRATVATANVSLTLTVAGGYDKPTLQAQVAAVVTAAIAGIGMGGGLPYSRLATIAYGVSAGIVNVTGVTLNGGTADLAGTRGQLVRAGAVSVG